MENTNNITFKKVPRVLIAKCGLDGHDRGAKFIAKALRDAGMEIIYTGIRQTPQDVARTAVQEDVDLVGLSILSGAHNSLFPKLIEELKAQGAPDIPVFGGGVIPNSDIPFLKSIGVKAIFTPGATAQSVIEEIKKILEGNS